jgi:Spy/CpxP family protein refolding chaperone
MLREKLGVTDEQLEKMKPIFEQQREKFAALKDDTALTMEQKREKMHGILANTMEELKGILTPEQLAKLKDEMEKRRAARGQKQQ